jgi:molybdate transport system substrate-binding protein
MRVSPGLLAAVVLLALTGCSGSSNDAGEGDNEPESTQLSGPLVVFAAASLTDVFGQLGEKLHAEHPGVEVSFNFGPSSGLATQINQGAPADVFASANEKQMTVVTDAGKADGASTPFAENVLVIAVPAGNPAGITGLADFANPDRTLATCAPEVPCGAAADAVFKAAGITPSIDTLEEDVRATLTKVELGEVDAALVYTTDAKSAGDAVQVIEFPEAEQAVNVYPIVRLKAAPNPDAAQAFTELVLSDVGQNALREAGFRSP